MRKFAMAVAVLTMAATATAFGGDAEAEVKTQVKALQDAIKAKDAAKVWMLTSTKSQMAADKIAKELVDKYAKADDAGKKKLEAAVVLPAGVLAKMTGQDYFRTKAFDEKYSELGDSKIDKIVVEGKKATIYYTEPDNDKRTLTYALQDKEWKADLKIVRAD